MARKPKGPGQDAPDLAVPAVSTPEGIASEVKKKITDKAGNVAIEPVTVLPPSPIWTAEGVGELPVAIHNFLFAYYDMADMSVEEEKALAADFVYYLGVRWPTGSRYDPECRLLVRLSGLWIPRVIALQKRKESERLIEQEALRTVAEPGVA